MWRPRLIVLQPTPYCNISCTYCYLGSRNDRQLMSRVVVEAIRDKIFSQLAPNSPTIVWHAGEPTVAPISWYKSAYEVLVPAKPAGATFTIQSNGVSVSDGWIEFLRQTNTQIGLSIDRPQRFHDLRRRTRAGGPTWTHVVETLRRLRSAQLDPNVLTVLHPQSLQACKEFYQFYRDHEITKVSFSIDEAEGANTTSSFAEFDYRPHMVAFLVNMLQLAFADGYPLYIKEIERIAHSLASGVVAENEQVEAWQVIVVAANGNVTSFSPEFMETKSASHNNFCFGNILENRFDELSENAFFKMSAMKSVRACRFAVMAAAILASAGAALQSTRCSKTVRPPSGETSFCRLSTQAAADSCSSSWIDKHSRPHKQLKSPSRPYENQI